MPDIRPALPSSAGRRPAVSRALLAALSMLGGLALAPARAQVTTDDSALSALPGATHPKPQPDHSAPGHTTSGHSTSGHTAPARPATGKQGGKPTAKPPEQATPAAAAQPEPARPAPTPPPTIPAAPPPPPIIRPPVVDVPLHPPAPPPEVPVKADATGTATDRPDGVRLTFAPGNADMNAAMIDRVKAFAATLAQSPYARAEIDATASGASDDVSTPRRLSLTRGLAIRSILIHAGIASTRIYVRAIGVPSPDATHDPAATHDAPADHVDVTRSDMVASAPSSSPDHSEQRPAP